MTCMGCVGHVTEALQGLPTASDVTVDLETGLATLNFTGEDGELFKTVKGGRRCEGGHSAAA